VLELLGVQQAQHSFLQRDAGGDEDREHDGVAGPAFGAGAAKEEGGADRERRQRVATVVDQVGEQGDAAGEEEDERLGHCRRGEHAEADQDGTDTGAGAENRPVDETVRVATLGVAAVIVEVVVRKRVSVLDVVAQEISSIRSE
jgi:hypothetical protein